MARSVELAEFLVQQPLGNQIRRVARLGHQSLVEASGGIVGLTEELIHPGFLDQHIGVVRIESERTFVPTEGLGGEISAFGGVPCRLHREEITESSGMGEVPVIESAGAE